MLREDDLEPLLARLSEVIQGMGVPHPARPRLEVDAEVAVTDLTEDLLGALDGFEPTGEGNPQPVLLARGLQVVERRAVGSSGAHLKLTLAGEQRLFEAIAFRQGDRISQLPRRLDAAFHFERNEFRGRVTPQLRVIDFRQAEDRAAP